MAFQKFNQTFIAYCLCALNVYDFVFAVRFFFIKYEVFAFALDAFRRLCHFRRIGVDLSNTKTRFSNGFKFVFFLQSFKTSKHHSIPAIQCLFYPFSWAMSFHILLFIYDKNYQNRIFALVSNFNDEYARINLNLTKIRI